MNPKTIYCVIMGDLVDSRNLKNRGEVQETLDRILEQINRDYKSDLSSRFMISQGDEFQGLLENGAHIMEILNLVQAELFPVKVRFGIGLGEVWTSIDKERSVHVDGPAYYCARDAIDGIKAGEKKNGAPKTNIGVCAQGVSPLSFRMLNTTLSLMHLVRENWTGRQLETVQNYRRNGEKQQDCAASLGISQSAVNQTLKKAHYSSYRAAEQAVQQELDQIWRKMEHERTDPSVSSGASAGRLLLSDE